MRSAAYGTRSLFRCSIVLHLPLGRDLDTNMQPELFARLPKDDKPVPGAISKPDHEPALRNRDQILSLAEESAGIGVWDAELASGLVRGTAQFFKIMGLPPTSEPVPQEVFRALRITSNPVIALLVGVPLVTSYAGGDPDLHSLRTD